MVTGFNVNQISALSFKGQAKSSLLAFDKLNGLALKKPIINKVDEYTTGELETDTLFRYKGLSNLAIVLTEVEFEELKERVARLLFVGASRALARIWLGDQYLSILKRASRPKVLIYGAGTTGRQLAAAMANSHEMRVVGFLDDDDRLHGHVLNGKPIYNPADLDNLYVRSNRSGELVPLSNLVSLTELAEPGEFNRFNRLRAISLSAGLAPGYTLGEALEWVRQTADEELPDRAQLDYKGESREYQRAGGAVIFTFAMALLVVYLVLAAQFESFLHPVVIMLTVPLAVLGALLGLWIFGSSLNLFSQIGIVMLVGLAAKNGILIVEFANQLRDEGRAIRDAIVEAAAVRMRPILMTSIATMMGAVPLVAFGGPGSASRATIGIVIIAGVAFSTLLSLFVVPAFYTLLAPYTRSPEAVARKLEKLERETPSVGGHA